MTHKFLIELVDDYKGYEQDVDYLERIYGAEPIKEHDEEIYNKAIDNFADYLRMSYDKGMRLTVAMCKNEVEKFKFKALYSRFINAIDDCVKSFKEIEQLKEGGKRL